MAPSRADLTEWFGSGAPTGESKLELEPVYAAELVRPLTKGRQFGELMTRIGKRVADRKESAACGVVRRTPRSRC